MTLPELAGNRKWTITGVAELPWPWPPSSPIRMFRRTVPEGTVTLTIEPSGRIVVLLGDVRAIVSCTLAQPVHTATTICITRNGKKLDLHLNAKLVASNTKFIPATYEFPAPDLSKSMYDFSKENANAAARRRSTVFGTHPRRGRERRPDSEILSALRDELLQLTDLLVHIRDGRMYHAAGAASRVRLLIADNTQPAPLLQWCAGIVDAPLIIYTAAQPRLPLPTEFRSPTALIRFAASESPRLLIRNPIDLDVWLSLRINHIGNASFTNKEMLHKIGSTIAAHFDVDKHPLVDAMQSMYDGNDISWLIRYICKAANLCLFLGNKILKKAEL